MEGLRTVAAACEGVLAGALVDTAAGLLRCVVAAVEAGQWQDSDMYAAAAPLSEALQVRLPPANPHVYRAVAGPGHVRRAAALL